MTTSPEPPPLSDSGEGFEVEAAAHLAGAVAGEAAAGEDGLHVVVVVRMLAGLRGGGGKGQREKENWNVFRSSVVERELGGVQQGPEDVVVGLAIVGMAATSGSSFFVPAPKACG